jgi:CPA2 family monovalent cation:H+ antiporter-2
VAICFGAAWLTSLAGVSLSLGAFLAGLVVSESRFSEMAFGEILPLQILFSATFFVSVGLLLDLGFVAAHPLLVLAAVAGVLLVKVVTTGLSLKGLGYTAGTAAGTGLVLAQIGEFSFVLERAGRAVGLFPAGLEEGGPEVFIASTVVLMMATPFLALLGARLHRQPSAARTAEGTGSQAASADPSHPQPTLRDHVLIAGYGAAGRSLAPVLDALAIPYLILTLSPDGAREAEGGELRVLRGNYTRTHELTRGAVRGARLLVVADDELETTRRVVSAARALSPALWIVARTRFASEAPMLRSAGASAVVAEDAEGVAGILAEVLGAYGVAPATIAGHQETLRRVPGLDGPGAAVPGQPTVRLTARQRRSERCTHAEQTRAVRPSAPGCEECLRLGDVWVHLRVCMTCGHVGCCDESKNRHATAHHRDTGHPIVKSLDPGEDWAWCYEDQTVL